MDEMRLSELYTVTDDLKYIDRTSWDQIRIQCLISAQKASKKKLKLKDIFSLPWDSLDHSIDEQMQILAQQKVLEDLLNGKIDNNS